MSWLRKIILWGIVLGCAGQAEALIVNYAFVSNLVSATLVYTIIPIKTGTGSANDLRNEYKWL